MKISYELSLTTQGPLYPPSEVMDEDGNFVVIGMLNREADNGMVKTEWGRAIVSPDSPLPPFGERAPYTIIKDFSTKMSSSLGEKALYTLPLPLPCANYPMLFAPEQYPGSNDEQHQSYAFHEAPIPDAQPEHGRQLDGPVRLKDWMRAQGSLTVTVTPNKIAADFDLDFSGLLPNSLYTVMALRENDLNPKAPTRPGPLGIPNVFVTNQNGTACFHARLPNPFPKPGATHTNRVVNIVVLWMSYQMNHGGAIGRYGLGGDIHALLKLREPSFQEFQTHN